MTAAPEAPSPKSRARPRAKPGRSPTVPRRTCSPPRRRARRPRPLRTTLPPSRRWRPSASSCAPFAPPDAAALHRPGQRLGGRRTLADVPVPLSARPRRRVDRSPRCASLPPATPTTWRSPARRAQRRPSSASSACASMPRREPGGSATGSAAASGATASPPRPPARLARWALANLDLGRAGGQRRHRQRRLARGAASDRLPPRRQGHRDFLARGGE